MRVVTATSWYNLHTKMRPGVPAKITMNVRTYAALMKAGRPHFLEQSCWKSDLQKGLYADMDGWPIYVSKTIPDGEIHIEEVEEVVAPIENPNRGSVQKR